MPEPRDLLPEILAPGLDVIFVGAAPSHTSAQCGHYYAGPTNRFWLLLHQAGFTPHRLAPEEDESVLQFGIGLTGILRHLSSSANHLLPEPDSERRCTMQAQLTALAPRIVCYNGKDVHRMCTGAETARWGLQRERAGQSAVFIAISSSARADKWALDRLDQYRELKALVDSLRSVVDSSVE